MSVGAGRTGSRDGAGTRASTEDEDSAAAREGSLGSILRW